MPAHVAAVVGPAKEPLGAGARVEQDAQAADEVDELARGGPNQPAARHAVAARIADRQRGGVGLVAPRREAVPVVVVLVLVLVSVLVLVASQF